MKRNERKKLNVAMYLSFIAFVLTLCRFDFDNAVGIVMLFVTAGASGLCVVIEEKMTGVL